MSTISRVLNDYTVYIQQFSVREKVLFYLTVIVMVWGGIYWLWLTPVTVVKKQLQHQTDQVKGAIMQIDRFRQVNEEKYQSVYLPLKAQLAALNSQIKQMQDKTHSRHSSNAWIKLILQPHKHLSFIAIDSHQLQREKSQYQTPWSHQYKVKMSGDFAQALLLLYQLEHMPEVAAIEEMQMEINEFPMAELTFIISTYNPANISAHTQRNAVPDASVLVGNSR